MFHLASLGGVLSFIIHDLGGVLVNISHHLHQLIDTPIVSIK